jgi:hypothetical protein
MNSGGHLEIKQYTKFRFLKKILICSKLSLLLFVGSLYAMNKRQFEAFIKRSDFEIKSDLYNIEKTLPNYKSVL